EAVPQRPELNLVAVPEAPARTADVPVREIVDERVERANERRRPVPLVRIGHLRNELLGPLEQPTVERLQLAGRVGSRPEAGDVRIVDEELDRVPERQQAAPDLGRRAVAELEVLARQGLDEHEAV